MSEVKKGQIWVEVDPRFARFVRVERVNGLVSAAIRSVVRNGDGWMRTSRSRETNANLSRFDGKRGNYRLVEDVLDD